MAILSLRRLVGNIFLPSFALDSFCSDETSLFKEELSLGANAVWPASDVQEK